MTFFVEKGWVVGEEWQPGHTVGFKDAMIPFLRSRLLVPVLLGVLLFEAIDEVQLGADRPASAPDL